VGSASVPLTPTGDAKPHVLEKDGAALELRTSGLFGVVANEVGQGERDTQFEGALFHRSAQ